MDYTDEERRIYEYADGSHAADGSPVKVKGDPLYLNRRLYETTKGQLNKLLGDVRQAVPLPDLIMPRPTEAETAAGWIASGKLATASRETFELVPYDKTTGTGANEQESLDVLYDFLEFCTSKKKPVEKSPICTPTSPD